MCTKAVSAEPEAAVPAEPEAAVPVVRVPEAQVPEARAAVPDPAA